MIVFEAKTIVPGQVLDSIQGYRRRVCLRVLVAWGVGMGPRELLCRLLDGISRALRLICREISLIQELVVVCLPLLGYGEGIIAAVPKALVYKVPIVAWVLALLGVMGEAPLLVIITACHHRPPRMASLSSATGEMRTRRMVT